MKQFIATSLVFFSPLIFADDLRLSDELVTATRTETAKNQLATAATIYTRQDITRLQVRTLPELLRGTTGLDMTQNGGYGKTSNVFMRGTNSDHVLVLIDGVKVGSVTTGTSPFEYMPVDQIERVEITRGPNSSLYGSEAIGGVIQIFTRKGELNATPKVSLDAGGGSYDTYRFSGNVSGKVGNTWYNLSAARFFSEGFNAQKPTTGAFAVNQPDRDGYSNTGVSAKVGHHFDTRNTDLEAYFTRAQGMNEYDGTASNKTDYIEQVAGTSLSTDVLKNWRATFRLGQSLDWSDNFNAKGNFYSRFNTARWNASWLNQFQITDHHQFILGSDYRLDTVDSNTKYNEKSRYDVGVFGELHSTFWDTHFLNASIRWDKNQAFGDAVTGNIGWRDNWQIDRHNTISTFASFGNAFKAPTFNQLYFPNFGNANLKAEESKSVEVGLAGTHAGLNWELRAFHTDIDNMITTVTDPKTRLSTARNIGKARIDGLESEFSTEIFGWTTKLNLSMLSPKDRLTNLRLPRRADKTLGFDVSRSFGDVDVGTHIIAQDHRYDDVANNIKVGGYVTVDLRTAYHLNKNWEFNIKLNNVLDNKYQTVNNYNTAERNFFVSIHYNN